MIRQDFRILLVDLSVRKAHIVDLPGRETYIGGSGLAAMLFEKYGDPAGNWNDPGQPLIFTIGPLTGYFPLMSKTVCGFLSPYHGQYAESHAGGRSALALRFADLDALVITGKASGPCVLSVGSRHMEIKDAPFLWGKDVFTTGKMLRHMLPGSGTRSILRIGPAGENGCAYACINVDTYRHFGRLGAGAVMGGKNLKAIAIVGDASFPLPEGKEYAKCFHEIYDQITETSMMSKYHDLGTAGNVAALDALKSLPWRNLQATSDPERIDGISGEKFAKDMLLRNTACSGCPVGCIHIGYLREKFMADNRYLYKQVAYDYEPIFALGSMLGFGDGFKVLGLMDAVEREGLDCMSGGVALAWATEALEKGLITEAETLTPLSFGEPEGYKVAIGHLGAATNEFYRLLAQGTLVAAKHYHGEDFACVLGQEMAGYATGETFFVSETLSFRHSHLDSSAYSADQKKQDQDAGKIVAGFVKDEASRCILTSAVGCLFGRGVYTEERLKDALASLGLQNVADNLLAAGEAIQKLRWRLRMRTGCDPMAAKIPKRYSEVVTWKGPIDTAYMEELRQAYATRLLELGREEEAAGL
ncbi:MAG: aldehyde ferredoxin oxidoreductase [Deltaproteobacteria bacterium HGW-Deltaproteobacteria-8]|jgi:aldehyde:ferredoxin oxidoreductase|nr:MAG: aldehyde ferredoxin oxidoreductase [Deltaproteobacteria bacterium HGW-Deltaproteobacteria-8]